MGHHHDHAAPDHGWRLGVTLALVVLYMGAEVVGGLLSGSLALLADAGHMLSDAASLAMSLIAVRIARRPASATHTFGYQRAEILAALVNGAALVAIAISLYIVVEAVQRVSAPTHVHGGIMLAVASGGLVINLLGLWILHEGKTASLNVRGAWLHVLSDALGSVAAIAAGIAVATLGWHWADPAASILIAVLVVYASWTLIRETVGVLMQAVPSHIDLAAVEHALCSIDGVLTVHDLHIWAVTSDRAVMSAHLSVDAAHDRQSLVEKVHQTMRDDFDLHHSTIQLDCPGDCDPCDSTAS